MEEIYSKIQEQAVKIAAIYPEADFYRDFADEMVYSLDFFSSDPVVCELHAYVADHLEDDYGHGLTHVRKVAHDAGALAVIEGEQKEGGTPGASLRHRVRLAQCAGLLHDIRRKHKHHAKEGAVFSRQVLAAYPFSEADKMDICLAIENHEAFGETRRCRNAAGAVLSDCLYDADKFRWGPENFTHTVWAMAAYARIPIHQFMALYPKGVSFLEKIKATFRTPTGRKYGPQFIDLGLDVGRDIRRYIEREFAALL